MNREAKMTLQPGMGEGQPPQGVSRNVGVKIFFGCHSDSGTLLALRESRDNKDFVILKTFCIVKNCFAQNANIILIKRPISHLYKLGILF